MVGWDRFIFGAVAPVVSGQWPQNILANRTYGTWRHGWFRRTDRAGISR